ncbi:hypothetical protein ACX1HO_04075 [Yersinia enterocolitica]|uniref:hypothetical protein n=1 Tax=Yersinia enterocolitica TaxID=630 RepID=UPI000AFEB5E4|nr:hypothetical protein [Yersinia enterocolitica]MBX9488095.1 hypothetical protein [Yersinia enterocolitica]MBX9491527.1 hypothetical protein [Yersinia enterocolitica]HDV7158918.1 hypothetical protein [Yersinia enterocolitica]HEB9653528.1 hypothetical protein [Yersinia enterocolitica]
MKLLQIDSERHLVVESMMTTSSMGKIITTKNCQFLMGGELDGVDRPVIEEPGASYDAPTQLTIAYILQVLLCPHIITVSTVVRFNEFRTVKSGSGFCRCGVTIAQRRYSVQLASITLGQTFFVEK